MSGAPVNADRNRVRAAPPRRALRPGVEFEFTSLTLSRELSRGAVTRLLITQAETGGWELDRLRISENGTRRVQLRRRIIRQRATLFA